MRLLDAFQPTLVRPNDINLESVIAGSTRFGQDWIPPQRTKSGKGAKCPDGNRTARIETESFRRVSWGVYSTRPEQSDGVIAVAPSRVIVERHDQARPPAAAEAIDRRTAEDPARGALYQEEKCSHSMRCLQKAEIEGKPPCQQSTPGIFVETRNRSARA